MHHNSSAATINTTLTLSLHVSFVLQLNGLVRKLLIVIIFSKSPQQISPSVVMERPLDDLLSQHRELTLEITAHNLRSPALRGTKLNTTNNLFNGFLWRTVEEGKNVTNKLVTYKVNVLHSWCLPFSMVSLSFAAAEEEENFATLSSMSFFRWTSVMVSARETR